jgi:putative salt-induced outer membrane protein
MSKLPLTLVMLAGLTNGAFAQDSKPWKVDVDLGIINTSGNTETTSVQAKIDAKQTLNRWENQYILSGLYKKDQVTDANGVKSDETTAEKYFVSGKTAYLLGVEKSYIYGYASHTHDEFGAYHRYTTVSLGYGDWIISGPTLTWFAEAGPGYQRGEKPLNTVPVTYSIEEGVIFRGASELIWKFSPTAEFKQLLSVEAGEDNTRTISETSVAASITTAMKMKVGINVASDSQVAADKKHTDTTTFVNLVYSF